MANASKTGMLVATCTALGIPKELLRVNGQSIKEMFTAYGMGSQTPSARAIRRRDCSVTLTFRADVPVPEATAVGSIVVTVTEVGGGTLTLTWTNMNAKGNVGASADLDSPPAEITQEFHLEQDLGTTDNFSATF